ncbi:MAG: carbohydrate kinase family protein [Patescibacteria group bacterium]
MPQYDVVTIGGSTRDINFYTRDGRALANPYDITRQKMIGFEYGGKIISEKAIIRSGGGGGNTAVTLARLGLKVASFVCLGQDREGEVLLAKIKKEHIDTRFVSYCGSAMTGFSFVIIDENLDDHIAFLFRGANNYLTIKTDALLKLQTDWIYVSSLSGQHWRQISDKILAAVKQRGFKLAWNPGETQLKAGKRGLEKLLKNTEVLLLNKNESIRLVMSAKGKIKGIDDPRVLLKTIKNWGPNIFVLTNGRKGAYAYDGKKIYFSPIYPIKIADTTGAGDAFGASFIAGLIRYKYDLKKAIKLATINTAYQVSVLGAQEGMLFAKDLKRFKL